MDLTEMMKAGEQILQRALEAVCKYQQAIDSSAPAVEVEHLHIEAESLMRAVREYQMRAKGSSRSLRWESSDLFVGRTFEEKIPSQE